MVAEARSRLEGVAAARFFVCDGLRVPEAACDRRYRQIVALAVLIHCPRDVVRSLVASAYELLEEIGHGVSATVRARRTTRRDATRRRRARRRARDDARRTRD